MSNVLRSKVPSHDTRMQGPALPLYPISSLEISDDVRKMGKDVMRIDRSGCGVSSKTCKDSDTFGGW